MWKGYLTFDDVEIVNASRFEAYAADAAWFRPVYRNLDLRSMLGHTAYTDPATDLAPWYDPDVPASADFYGTYPLDVVGLTDSTGSAAPIEHTQPGATPGRVRFGSGAAVITLALGAATEEALDYGLGWLRRATLGAQCSDQLTTSHALGLELGYLSADPHLGSDLDDPVETLTRFRRYRRHVTIAPGPTVVASGLLSCGGAYATVTMTALLGDPRTYGVVMPLLQGYMDPDVDDPWVPGAVAGTADTTGTAFTDVDCEPDLWSPLYDPLCPPLVTPPAPPAVPLGCFTPITDWTRRKVTLPAAVIPAWTEAAPVLTVAAPPADDLRNLRVRIYGDPDGTFDPDDTPCDFHTDLLISYIPAGGVLELDGAAQTVHITTSTGHRRRADTVVFASNGDPIDWHTLTCGYAQIVTLDLPDDIVDLPVVDLALAPLSL